MSVFARVLPHGSAWIALSAVLLPLSAMGVTVTNGDFANGLTDWTAMGDVTVNALEEAVIGDKGVTDSSLYQGIAAPAGSYTLQFDFRNLLSANLPTPPPFVFLDTFFASLYFTDDLGNLDIENGVFDAVTNLFDLDANGVFCGATNTPCSGTVSSSPAKGPDWLHFSVTFTNAFNYIVPAFEFFDLNTIANDSQVLIDNVIITAAPIPEPAIWSLLLIGLPALACRRSAPRRP